MDFPQPNLNENITKGRFKGHVAVVTGGASGIGKECVRRFANDGASVAFLDINKDGGRKYEAEAQSEGHDVTFFNVDVCDRELCFATLDTIAQRHGGSINYLVNCAACFIYKGLEAVKDDWERVLAVNVEGYANMVQACHPHMKKAPAGDRCVVNIASGSAFVTQPNNWTYQSSKGAEVEMSKSMALSLARYGIRVVSVSPGTIWTSLVAKIVDHDKELAQSIWGKSPMLTRCGESAEVAAVVAFLCSRDAGFITGTDVKVDGGYTAIGPEGHSDAVGRKQTLHSKSKC
ncbi:uncharacterized protein LOC106172067 isoform X1 [Lingula anatina]|uniref:Uncharacterized protein LOC106172067 isoform X1 n=1 Tax=Lingula anatina TaxID=7574 RepID=A0A1S3JCR5_LINAN|nr:uncharacterized protein LOC106172067 isoform X1 [Lingula anatina]|eukprot:XP_013408113.1 uncharacterized protein LOC106172067 isoform X1 [Lingula anatina]